MNVKQTNLRKSNPEPSRLRSEPEALHLLDEMESAESKMQTQPARPAAGEKERLAYSVQEAADLLGVHYFSVYRLVQRRKLRACRVLSGKLLIPRSELERLLKG